MYDTRDPCMTTDKTTLKSLLSGHKYKYTQKAITDNGILSFVVRCFYLSIWHMSMVSYLFFDYKYFCSQFSALWYNNILWYVCFEKKEKEFYLLAFDFFLRYTAEVKIYFLFYFYAIWVYLSRSDSNWIKTYSSRKWKNLPSWLRYVSMTPQGVRWSK